MLLLAFFFFLTHLGDLSKVTLALDKVSFNSLPMSILPHVAYYSFMFLGNTPKFNKVIQQGEATVVCGSRVACPTLSSGEPMSALCPRSTQDPLSAPTVEEHGSSIKS